MRLDGDKSMIWIGLELAPDRKVQIPIKPDVWTHIVAIIDAENDAHKVYINGTVTESS